MGDMSSFRSGPRHPDAHASEMSTMHDDGPSFDICFAPGPPTSAVIDQAQLRNWLSTWLPGSLRAKQWATIDKWRIPSFVALVYPSCKSAEGARLLCAWITWLHLFDDRFDNPAISRDRAASEAFIEPYRRYASEQGNGGRPAAASEGHDELLSMFIELNEWTVAPMSRAWRARWFSHLVDYVQANVIETTDRAKGMPLLPEDLIVLKRTCMGQQSALDLVERTITGELSERAHELVSPVIDIVSDITGSVNDPISLARELERGDIHNLIMSLTYHEGLTEPEAIEWLQGFVATRCRDLALAISRISHDPAIIAEHEAVDEWLACCGYWVRGYHDWLLETKRYQVERKPVSAAGSSPILARI